MGNQLFIAAGVAVLMITYVAMALAAYIRMRGTRIVVCPETDAPAAVDVDATHAALRGVFEPGDITVENCSRWPEREGCDQACVRQIARAPRETLAFEILSKWYKGKSCAMCGRDLPPLNQVGPKPGFFNAIALGLEPTAWDQVPAEHLPAILKTHLPICATCTLLATFRREHGDLVVDRHRTAERDIPMVH
jgi:hypothetical protein